MRHRARARQSTLGQAGSYGQASAASVGRLWAPVLRLQQHRGHSRGNRKCHVGLARADPVRTKKWFSWQCDPRVAQEILEIALPGTMHTLYRYCTSKFFEIASVNIRGVVVNAPVTPPRAHFRTLETPKMTFARRRRRKISLKSAIFDLKI